MVTSATRPAITTQPVSTTIPTGNTATFSVIASGTTPTFQWYVGNSGVTTNPVAGATSTTFTTPALTSTTSYWVRATGINSTGSADSNAATATVQAPAPPSFATWAATLEISNGLAAGTISSYPLGDYDHDGRPNLIEYAFGTSPVIGNDPAPRMPVASITTTDFILRYQCDTALTDVTFTAQACSALGNWLAPGDAGAPSGFTDTVIATNGTLQTHEAKLPRTTTGNGFMRLRVTRP